MTTTATTADGAAISLGDEQITKLRGALRGALMLNDHAGYENARQSARDRLLKLVGEDLPFFYDSTYNVTYDAKTGAFPSTIIYGRDGKEAARLVLPADWSSPAARSLIQAVADGAV